MWRDICLKLSAASLCAVAAMTPRPTTTNTTPATPSCFDGGHRWMRSPLLRSLGLTISPAGPLGLWLWLRDNISTFEEAIADCALPMPPGSHLTCVGSLNRLNLIGIRSTLERPSKNSAKHQPEDTIHLLTCTASTTTCRIARLCKERLSIYNWNPGPRGGREGASEEQIAGKWHVITLQEAIGYVDHEFFTNRFHVTHYGGCAVLFNKDTFFPDVSVKSICLHDTE